jgi:methyltransferase (TIGR00027 family)
MTPADAPQPSGEIQNISDTALWVAVYRARETERADAAFRDPYARTLAGERGEQMAAAQPFAQQNEWSFLGRTWIIDRFVQQEVDAGADLVINLACGLDTRQYRMPLPPTLRWVEVDLPPLLAYKRERLAGVRPVSQLETIELDLGDVAKRRQLFTRLGGESKRALVITEGLLVYLSRDENTALAHDLAAQASFQRWILDVSSPGLLNMMQQAMGAQLQNSPLKFGPEEGLAFWEALGWPRLAVKSMAEGAQEINRLPDWLKPYMSVPVPEPAGNAVWGGVALLGRR